MGRRPNWRTPVFETTSAPNAHLLVKVRTPFGVFTPGDGRTQCKVKARSTGRRCRQNAVQGSQCCKVHGGLRYLDKRIKEQGGPLVSAKSVPVGMQPRRYDCASAFILDDLAAHLPMHERSGFSKLGLGARGRKLAEIAKRELNR